MEKHHCINFVFLKGFEEYKSYTRIFCLCVCCFSWRDIRKPLVQIG